MVLRIVGPATSGTLLLVRTMASDSRTSIAGRATSGAFLLARAARGLKLFGGKLIGAKLLALSTGAAAVIGSTFVWLGKTMTKVGETLSPQLTEALPPAPAAVATISDRKDAQRVVTAAAAVAIVAFTGWNVTIRRHKRASSSSRWQRLDKTVVTSAFVEALKQRAAAEHAPVFPSRAPSGRFLATKLTFGRPEDAALGVLHFMCVTRNGLPMAEGTRAILREISEHGTADDRECLEYILHASAGSSARRFPNSPHARDCDDTGGVRADRMVEGKPMTLADFITHPKSRAARLEEAHVVALRLYSTAAYRSLNEPLRDIERFGRGEAHRLPVTVAFLDQAIRQLRANGAPGAGGGGASEAGGGDAWGSRYLYRGLRNASLSNEFMMAGGSELGMMSTTTSLAVAMRYCASEACVLLRLCTSSFMDRGADIAYLSCFANEHEVLYPPLCYLQPTGDIEKVCVGAASATIVDVTPHFPS